MGRGSFVIGLNAKLTLSGNFLSANNHVARTNYKHMGRSQKNKNYLLLVDDRLDG